MPTGGGSGGGGGLSTVSVTPRLTGNGTGGSPLNIAGWPETYYQVNNNASQSTLFAANQTAIWGIVLPYALTFSHVGMNITTADGVNSYDFGIYSQAGTLLADIGAQTLPSTGLRSFATSQGTVTIAPGLYLFAATGNAGTAAFGFDVNGFAWVRNVNVAASVGGALPASITAQVTGTPGINPPFAFLF